MTVLSLAERLEVDADDWQGHIDATGGGIVICGPTIVLERAAATALRTSLCPKPDGYACSKCGRRDGLDCVIPNHLWNQIEAETGHNVLCAWCLDAECAERGWTVRALLAFGGKAISAGTEPENNDSHWERHLGDLTARCWNAEAALRIVETSLALATADLRAGVAEIEWLRAREAELVALLREARQKLFSDGHRDYDDDDCDICLWLRDIKAKLAQIDAATNTAGEKS